MVNAGSTPMTNAYTWVQWNTHKRIYDLALVIAIVLYLITFVGLSMLLSQTPEEFSPPILLIRALGTLAVIMLHLILIIGPLARFTPKMNALLYNRRHLGVAFFIVASLHGLLVFAFYGGFGIENPITAVLAGSYRAGGIPFELFGFIALLIFAIMAATSHDFWLANLGHAFWKTMHMGVYIAYTLVLAHMIFGMLQSEHNILYPIIITIGALAVASLHLASAFIEHKKDGHSITNADQSQWVQVCTVDEIKADRAKIVQIENQERIAIFRHDNKLSAVANVCAHQGGPLGEGKIIDGCITCPWHGYQYRPACGQSPPPYTEKIPTYEIKIEGQRVLINPIANEPGTPVDPATVDSPPATGDHNE